ncbi:MAG: acylphosphatase [Ardenticatenaceae bacterium]|nr:acylphosphatase [Ardenticatenaceae bacterium]
MHAWIYGKLRGKLFAAQLQEVALELGVTGWLRFWLDGRVELVAEGNADTVTELLRWAGEGPDDADIAEVVVEDEPYVGEFDAFAVRR